MGITEADMKARTKEFAKRVLRLVDAIPETRAGRIVASQLARCGMSVGSNYRAACRGRSKLEFASKLGTVEEETDETMYWIEMLTETGMMPLNKVSPLLKEADEILRIVVASRKTVYANNRKSKIGIQKS